MSGKMCRVPALFPHSQFRIQLSGCAPAVEPFWKPRHIIQIEIKPGHRPHHLSLLPSGSDEVHDRLLRGVQSKWSKGSKDKILGREFSPA